MPEPRIRDLLRRPAEELLSRFRKLDEPEVQAPAVQEPAMQRPERQAPARQAASEQPHLPNANNAKPLVPATRTFARRAARFIGPRASPERAARVNRVFAVFERAAREQVAMRKAPGIAEATVTAHKFIYSLVKSGIPPNSKSLLPYVNIVDHAERAKVRGMPVIAIYKEALNSGILESLNSFFATHRNSEMPHFTSPELAGVLGQQLRRHKPLEQITSMLYLLEAAGRVQRLPMKQNLSVWAPAGIEIKGITYNAPFNALMLLLRYGGGSTASLAKMAMGDPALRSRAVTFTTKEGEKKQMVANRILSSALGTLVRLGLAEEKPLPGKKILAYFITGKGRQHAQSSATGRPSRELTKILSYRMQSEKKKPGEEKPQGEGAAGPAEAPA